ncbi:MAG TPA: D-glycero-beta-D-manno-heptose-7-phosphate kinase [Acidobacteriota bacterium]|nr:D-glycero-beta-D-manno-heptose-7-phosphate kinase [Acidobacteriota bacterium]
MTISQREELIEIIRRFEGCPILVAGDVILDRFVWGDVQRISPEAPVPVIEVKRESVHLGGAANVACNLAALGASPRLVGLVGQDGAARELRRELTHQGIDESGLISTSDRRTTTKTRIIAGHQQVCRADREDRHPAQGSLLADLTGACRDRLSSCKAVILSDYAKGVLVRDLVKLLIEQASREGAYLAVDPKSRQFTDYRGASIITPNKKEAEAAAAMPIVDEDSLLQAGRRLRQEAELGALLITRGEEGMTYLDADTHVHIPTAAREVYDVTGAGDTVTAVFTLAVACGALPGQAAELANHAAGIVVGKLGTSQVAAEELIQSLDDAAMV